MKKVFLICYGGGHAEIIKEIYKNLKKIQNIEIIILALTTSKYKFEQEKISYKLISDYFNEAEDNEVYKLGENFCLKNDIDTSIGKKETYLYHGYALHELGKKYSQEKIEEGFKKFGRAIFLPIEFMERVLKDESPNLVITTNSPRYEKAALIASKRLNIKTLYIEDLFGKDNPKNTIEIENFFKDEVYQKIYGDYTCILSEIVRENLDLNKVNKIFITGNPTFDKTLEYFLEVKKKEQRKKEKITLCYLSQKHPDNILIMENLIKITKENNFNLIVKIHPNEKIEDYLKEIDKDKNENIKIVNYDLYENIIKSDIVITIFSTAALEAAILNKPIIAKRNISVPFANLGIGLEFENINEIEKNIKRILNNMGNINESLEEARKKFRPSKKAGEQIKEIIEEILDNKF